MTLPCENLRTTDHHRRIDPGAVNRRSCRRHTTLLLLQSSVCFRPVVMPPPAERRILSRADTVSGWADTQQARTRSR